MAKHTPGPWRVASGNRLEIRGPRDEIGWPVPVVYNAGLHSDETAQANARLIAVAPEMLAALEVAYTSLIARLGPAHPITCQVGAAIAKATD